VCDWTPCSKRECQQDPCCPQPRRRRCFSVTPIDMHSHLVAYHKIPFTTTLKLASCNLQGVSYNMQQVTCNRRSHNCNKTFKLQGNGRRHVQCLPIRGAFSQQAANTIDWTVRSDWLQVASSCIILCTYNIMLMRFARLVQVLQHLLQVLS